MKLKFSNLLFTAFVILTIGTSDYLKACFDTYQFLNRRSMVYSTKNLAIETLGEYSFNKMSNPMEDALLMNFNIYYGLTKRFSIQAGAFSSEKTRSEFKIDEYGIKGVYNIFSNKKNKKNLYYVDTILACRRAVNNTLSFEVSVPNIMYRDNNIFVVHPVAEIIRGNGIKEYKLGGHLGVFHFFNNSAIVGIGAEYESAQNGANFNRRLVEGEAAASIFLGTKIGNIFYLQNELAKGLSNSRDFGFALTLKIFL